MHGYSFRKRSLYQDTFEAPTPAKNLWSTLMQECLSETTEQAQSDRLKAAYRWFSKNVPQQRPDNLRHAAAAATSLSVPRAKTTTYNSSPNKPSSPQAVQIQHATAFEVMASTAAAADVRLHHRLSQRPELRIP
jgi:hypothetical protein